MPSDDTISESSSQYELIVRKRGGQPGNKNSLRLGFYSRSWKLRERKGIEDVELVSLAKEISIRRVCIRRMFENRPEQAAIDQDARFVRAVSIAAMALNRLIRTQHKVTPLEADELRTAIFSMFTESARQSEAAPAAAAQPPQAS